MKRTTIRTAAAGATLVASAAIASPAFACLPSDPGPAQAGAATTSAASDVKPAVLSTTAKDPKSAARAFAQAQAAALQKLDRSIAALTAWRTKVASSDRLTSAQQSAWLAKLDTAIAGLQGLRDQVAADTTKAQIRDDFAAFAKAHDFRALWAWPARHDPAKHHQAREASFRKDAKADPRRGDCRHDAGTDPARWYDGRHRSDDRWGGDRDGSRSGDGARTASYHHDGGSRFGR